MEHCCFETQKEVRYGREVTTVEKKAPKWLPPVKLDTFFQALCSGSTLTRVNLKNILKSHRKPTNEIGDSAIDDILTLGTKIGVISKDGDVYRRTNLGDQFCALFGGEGLTDDIRERFHIQLQELGPYRDFLDYLAQPRSTEEIDTQFNQVTGKTLRQWGQFLGVINVDDSGRYQHFAQEKDVDSHTFKQALKSCHKRLSKDQMIGADRYFVDIGRLRSEVCQALRISPRKFNTLLTDLLNDPAEGHSIELTGAPATFYEEATTEPYSYKGKVFLYIALTGV